MLIIIGTLFDNSLHYRRKVRSLLNFLITNSTYKERLEKTLEYQPST